MILILPIAFLPGKGEKIMHRGTQLSWLWNQETRPKSCKRHADHGPHLQNLTIYKGAADKELAVRQNFTAKESKASCKSHKETICINDWKSLEMIKNTKNQRDFNKRVGIGQRRQANILIIPSHTYMPTKIWAFIFVPAMAFFFGLKAVFIKSWSEIGVSG